MRALILIGGFGTRLRPLTLSVLKPLVEFCNRPMLMHQIEALVGIKTVILAINEEAACLENEIRRMCKMVIKKSGVNVIFSYESEPLGTGGPLANAAHLLYESDEPFYVLNSDIICQYPFSKLMEFHKSHGKEGTMAVTKVKEPSRFGAVVFNDQSGAVQRFVEKPLDFIANKLRPTSLELEIFPPMVEDGELYCIEIDGIWMDIGRPKDFLLGMQMYLDHLRNKGRLERHDPPDFIGNVLIHPSVQIGTHCVIGPNVTLGPNVCIGDGVRIQDSAILSGAKVRSHSRLEGSIVGWNSDVGQWARLESGTVLGENVHVSDEVLLNGALVLPHNLVSASVHEPQVIL
ncbi:Mannose-1-phosphate guanyltransferase beta-A [Echinococcus granulosus]|uniref:mannose-1-phosphate guanylyltransferase n=1 Tax=Echinococcus granulosus TaxID=6210 RepID=W6UN39_ECHGR|nr:Mannose-1-phosphate guanyltransferase beta-A [Echinococcus granulosus]EUB62498.1 Mannose-1-phosphate guanyltransferase beta-A [Echinococcus granulosus]